MGVRKLTTYASFRNTLWTNIQLQDTVIAVDGLALVWFLYESSADCRCGGEYDEFAQTIRRFFNSLISRGVAPYVLIDGPTLCPTSRQENEILRSHKLSMDDCDDAFVLPLMAKLAFVQELRNLGIRFVVCDGEADQELAALANHWNCPIISNDSDFFIYDLPAGYIPLSSLDLTSRPITAKLYERPRLARLLRIPEDFLPLFASLMGNDYVGDETLAPFKKVLFRNEDITRIRTTTLIMTIASFISRYQSPGEALQSAVDLADLYPSNQGEGTSACASDDNDEETDLSSSSESQENDLKSDLEVSMSQYKISDNSFRGYFEQNETRTCMETRYYKRIPAYVIRSYRDGRFPVGYMGALVDFDGVQVLKCQVEDTSEASAHMCSIAIRLISYGIVTEGPTVLEFDRKDAELVCQELTPSFGDIPGYGMIPTLNNLREVDTIHRLGLLLIVLTSDTELIKSLPERFQLFAASVRYWIAKARPAVTRIWLQALLLVHLKLLDEKAKTLRRARFAQRRHLSVTFDIRCQHSYAQWQSVMMEALLLNQILIFPLPEPDIATLYSGITAQTIAQELSQGAQVDSFLELMEVYDQLYAAVTEGLGDRLF